MREYRENTQREHTERTHREPERTRCTQTEHTERAHRAQREHTENTPIRCRKNPKKTHKKNH